MMEGIESLQQLYERLVEVTQNELELKNDLLPYQPYVVDNIVEQITHMNSVINNPKTKDRWNAFSVEQHKIEIERLSYLINTYLRTRVKKIEVNAPHLIKMLRTDIDRALKFLSPLEAKYLDRYNDSIDTYMKKIIKDMPDNMQQFRLANVKRADKTEYAFVQGLTEATVEDGDAEIRLEPGVCRILTVSTIVDLLEKGSRQFKLI
jgi:GINS complex subunit 4